MTLDLSGRVALVTGGTRGIGRAISASLAASGATVLAHHSGRDEAGARAVAAALGAEALAADLADAGATDALWDEALARHGRLDVLVANAGVFERAPLDAPDWSDRWDRTLAVNLRAPAQLLRAAARHAAARRAAGEAGVVVRAVTVSSRAAFRGDDPDYLAYAASKGGLVALTKSVARGCPGIAAFGVAPGFTRTDMAAEAVAAREAELLAETALDRLTEPEDVAPLVTLLASGRADHATGTTIDVNAASYVR